VVEPSWIEEQLGVGLLWDVVWSEWVVQKIQASGSTVDTKHARTHREVVSAFEQIEELHRELIEQEVQVLGREFLFLSEAQRKDQPMKGQKG